MSSLSDITGIEPKLLERKFQLDPSSNYDPNQTENLIFLSPLVLLEDSELKLGGCQDIGAKTVLGRIGKDILDSDDHSLFQVPEITNLHMGYGKKSANKKGKMALTEEEAKVWKSLLDLSRFSRSRNDVEEGSLGEKDKEDEEEPMEIDQIDFPTPKDTQALALEPTEEGTDPGLVSPSKSGNRLKIPLKGRYILLFSILLIFEMKKKKRVENSNKDEEKIGANKISDFLLFWILPYLLHFNHRKVRAIIQHHEVNSSDVFSEFVKKSASDIIEDSFASPNCEFSDELQNALLEKYRDCYGQQMDVKYKLLKANDNSPIILVPKRYKVKKEMPACLYDIGKNWRKFGNVTLLDEFMKVFFADSRIQEDFFQSLRDLKYRQGINFAILLPDEGTFMKLMSDLKEKKVRLFSKPKEVPKGGRNLISPCIGLVKSTDPEKPLTVCFSYFQGNHSGRVAALFRGIGAHYLDHFTLALLHGLCLDHRDPQCRVGSLYPVRSARKILFTQHNLDIKSIDEVGKVDFSNAEGRFCRAEFPETYKVWENTVRDDEKVKKMMEKTKGKLNISPRFQKDEDLTVGFSDATNATKLRSIPFRADQRLKNYQMKAVNLNGSLLSRLAQCGRKDNIGVVLAISDICEIDGSGLAGLSDVIKTVLIHFVRAVVVAGLPEVYPPEPNEKNRDEIECNSSDEDDDESRVDQELTAGCGGGGAAAAVGAGSFGAIGTAASNAEPQIKQGNPSDEELEKLSLRIGECWKPLGRRLDIEEGLLTGFYKDNDEFREKIYKMLLHWKQRDGQAATYQVLYTALCHELVSQRLLGEEICCE